MEVDGVEVGGIEVELGGLSSSLPGLLINLKIRSMSSELNFIDQRVIFRPRSIHSSFS